MVTTTSDMVWNSISKRPRSSHKGTFGSVLAVAGSASYRGAAALAVEGALRTGAGIVTLASVEPVLAAVSARLPECCLCPCEAGAAGGIAPENIPRIQRQKATVLLLGPGLGYTVQSAARAAETRMLAGTLLPGFAGSAVLDADGLNAAADLLRAGKLPHPQGDLILTPHPGEMARLMFGSGHQRRPRGYGPPLCKGVGCRRRAERGPHRHCRAGWPVCGEPHRQPRLSPRGQRGRAGRHDQRPAGL